MESTTFLETKISLTPSDFNEVKTNTIDEMLIRKARERIENKCSEQGFIVPGSLQLISRSMGYFESARFTGDAIYYVKLEGRVIYPVDGIQILGKVIRKNKMGLYINYNDAIRIQVPRDLHLNEPEFEEVQIGDNVYVEIKRSKFAIHDSYILASGLFIRKEGSNNPNHTVIDEGESDIEEEQVAEPEESAEESAEENTEDAEESELSEED
jgi:DNA-directed RNA polymerase subunit E'/Rpb7